MTKYLLSMGEKGQFNVDLEDEVVRGSIVLDKGKMMWPPPAPVTPPVAAPVQSVKGKDVVKPPELSPFHVKLYETGGVAGMMLELINSNLLICDSPGICKLPTLS